MDSSRLIVRFSCVGSRFRSSARRFELVEVFAFSNLYVFDANQVGNAFMVIKGCLEICSVKFCSTCLAPGGETKTLFRPLPVHCTHPPLNTPNQYENSSPVHILISNKNAFTLKIVGKQIQFFQRFFMIRLFRNTNLVPCYRAVFFSRLQGC